MASASEFNQPVSQASTTPGQMSALGVSDNLSGLNASPTATSSGQLAVPNFSDMTDANLSSYLSSGNFSSLSAANTGATPTAAAAIGTPTATDTSGSSSSDIGSLISSLLGGGSLASLAEFGSLAGLGLAEANSQKSTNDALAGQLSSIGQPFTQAGEGILSQVQGGAGTPGSPLSDSIKQQTGAATTLGQIANTSLSNYQSGTLSKADEDRLQQTATAQKAAVASQLASQGITDSSVLDSQYQQIDSVTEQNRQTLLQAQYQVGTNALTQVQTTYNTLLNQSLALAGFGSGLQSQAIQLQIQSDTALTQQLTQLFGQIAVGYGNAVGGNKAGTTGGGAAGGSSGIGGLVNQVGNALLGGGGDALVGSLGNLASGAAADAAVTSQLGSIGATTAADSASIAADNAGWLASEPAGSAALGAGVDALGAGAMDALASTSAATVGADSAAIAAENSAWLAAQPAAAAAPAAASGTGAAAGSLAGGALGLGILAAPVVAGLMTSGVQTNAAYAQNLNDNLFSNDPAKAGGAMYELLAAQSDPDNRLTITPAQQQRIAALQGGLLYQMNLANPLNKTSGGAPAQKGVQRN